MKKIILIVILISFSSCSVGPNYVSPPIEVPDEWKYKKPPCEEFTDTANENLVYLDHWWEVFEDSKLSELEEVALQKNPELFIALSRINEAKALVGIAAADFYPQLNLNPQTTNIVTLDKTYNSQALGQLTNCCGNNSLTNTLFRAHEMLYFFPLNLSYEVDLWGKIRDRYNSALYNYEAQQADYDAVMLGLTSSLATAYFQLRSLDSEADLLNYVLKTREKAFKIISDRYEAQISIYADVALAGEEVESAKNLFVDTLRMRQIAENQIATLMGIPASEFSLEHLPLSGSPPCIPAGIPSQVLLRRPDVREAELQVFSQHYLVKAAYSQFFPDFNLTASIGFLSPIAKDFLKWVSRYWMDGVAFNQVVFDGGRLSNELKLQIARFNEAGGAYQSQVLTAFQEVESGLSDVDAFNKQYEITGKTVAWAQKAYDLYLERFKAGIIFYVDVVNIERDLLDFQITLNSLEGRRFISTVQFIKALGGGWDSP